MLWLLLLAPLAVLGLVAGADGDDDPSADPPQNETGKTGQEGGSSDDVLKGGEGADLLEGGAGDDLLQGAGGNDTLNGGEDDDLIFAQGGDDTVDGGKGDDAILGMWGDDTLQGGEGDDLLQGGRGEDTLEGGDGDDILLGVNVLDANRFLEEIQRQPWQGSETPVSPPVNSEQFVAQIDVISGADTLNGGAGNDDLWVGAGDTADGGDGEDYYILGPWLTDGDASNDTPEPAELTYRAEDTILVAFQGATPPSVDVSGTLAGTQEIRLDGELIATLDASSDQIKATQILLERFGTA